MIPKKNLLTSWRRHCQALVQGCQEDRPTRPEDGANRPHDPTPRVRLGIIHIIWSSIHNIYTKFYWLYNAQMTYMIPNHPTPGEPLGPTKDLAKVDIVSALVGKGPRYR